MVVRRDTDYIVLSSVGDLIVFFFLVRGERKSASKQEIRGLG